MPQDEHPEPISTPPGVRSTTLFLASSLALAGILSALFLTGYGLLRDHPTHASELLPELYGALALGLLVLAAQGTIVAFWLVRPYRQACVRLENLALALDQHSHRDPLTGALNRTAFDLLVIRELEALKRYDVNSCGILLDVDDFRGLNGRLGYEAGDQALRELAELLTRHMRRADLLFRWRSGRFMILASSIGEGQALRFAEKLRRLVAGHEFSGGARITVCMGAAQARGEDSPELFVGRIKAALAKAKELGPDAQAGGQER